MSFIANTPTPPYYAVIFTSHRTEGDNGYAQMAEKMVALASNQPGFLGVESAREDVGITVSYWSDIESIKKWKVNVEHQEAQEMGRKKWYSTFKVRLSKVEHDGYGLRFGQLPLKFYGCLRRLVMVCPSSLSSLTTMEIRLAIQATRSCSITYSKVTS
ncbi:antibiotic biosynthesis monooxygenase [Anaerolineales bacterium HSG24]|nr:antibiotic biosynthesis monooxygenase [Anaerolineales bacterium HSG24]